MFQNLKHRKFTIPKIRDSSQEEVTAWINIQPNTGPNSNHSDGTADFTGFRYNPAKCKRDVGYTPDAWINDLARGGNIETRRIAS